MSQTHNNILGRQLPARFFATAKKRVCFGNLDLGKLTGFPKLLGVRQGGFRNTLTPGQCKRRHIHEGQPLDNILAGEDCTKRALSLGIHPHHGDTCQNRVIGVHVIIVHMDQDVAACSLRCDVALFTDGALAIESDLLNLRKIGHQILDLVIAIIHDHPLQLLGRICLAQKGLLGKTKELAPIAGNRQDTDLRKFLLRRKKSLHRLLRLQGQIHALETFNPPLMALLVFLSESFGSLDSLAIREICILAELLDQRIDRGIRQISQTFGMRNGLGEIREQCVLCKLAKGRNVGKNEVAST